MGGAASVRKTSAGGLFFSNAGRVQLMISREPSGLPPSCGAVEGKTTYLPRPVMRGLLLSYGGCPSLSWVTITHSPFSTIGSASGSPGHSFEPLQVSHDGRLSKSHALSPPRHTPASLPFGRRLSRKTSRLASVTAGLLMLVRSSVSRSALDSNTT